MPQQPKPLHPAWTEPLQKPLSLFSVIPFSFKKKEYCNWIDDSYMMMGKANFYKREYKTAGEPLIMC